MNKQKAPSLQLYVKDWLADLDEHPLDREEVELKLEPTEPLLPLLEYRQALRDVPQQEGFPGAVVWPEG